MSIDPLASKFAHNSPYAFSENRVIDGRELEGAEYVHYYVFLESNGKTLINTIKVSDFRNMSDDQIQQAHGMGSAEFYRKYSESFGKKGPGVEYSYFITDTRDGRFISAGSKFEESGGAFSHGLYYGAGGTSQQGNRSSVPAGGKGNSFTYDEKPIDEVDRLAREHDISYDKAGVKDFHSDPAGLVADLIFVVRLKEYVANASKKGYKDAITERAPSSESIISANRAIAAFTILIANKIDNLLMQPNQSQTIK